MKLYTVVLVIVVVLLDAETFPQSQSKSTSQLPVVVLVLDGSGTYISEPLCLVSVVADVVVVQLNVICHPFGSTFNVFEHCCGGTCCQCAYNVVHAVGSYFHHSSHTRVPLVHVAVYHHKKSYPSLPTYGNVIFHVEVIVFPAFHCDSAIRGL